MKEPILEVVGAITGPILRIMPDIDFGSIWDKKNKRKIYFSIMTEFINTSYSELNEGEIVEALVVRTPRGLFAKTLMLKSAHAQPEAQV